MTKKRSTKRALLLSFLSLLMCVSMLIGSTYAWFTDSVTSANNKIQSGTLKIDLELLDKDTGIWNSLKENNDPIFNYDKWEPGYTDVKVLKVENEGTLALKWVAKFVSANELSILADVIDVYVKEDVTAYPTGRVDLSGWKHVGTIADFVNSIEETTTGELQAKASETLGIALKMQETAGNIYQDKTLGVFDIQIFATQLTYEEDSFGPDYDEKAPELTIEVTPGNIQDYLDGKYGTLSNVTLKLTAGNYNTLYLGRPTKYEGSNTVYTCETHDFTTDDAEAFIAHKAEAGYHTTPEYSTTLQNVVIEGVDCATVAGMIATSGHSYGSGYDYVLDKNYTSGSISYNTLIMKDVTFKNVAFTAKIDINTSQADSMYDGVTFDGCSFTTGGTNQAANGAAIRYYNESNNGRVRNITVTNSTFNNCFQGVYVQNVNGVTIKGNSFDTTGHNAVALQSTSEAVDLKNVVISNNVFKNIGDRVVRFGAIGADSDITMEFNVATNSGDEDGEVVKATSIEAGVKVTANYNSWGGTVVNPELRDVKVADITTDASSFKSAAANANGVGELFMTESIAVEDLEYVNFAQDTVVNGNGNSFSRDTASGNPLLVNTTNKVTFENIKFESVKGSAVLATRKEGANIEVNDCDFINHSAPSTGNTGIQVYASNVTMTFNRCTFNNMPIVTNSSYPDNIKLVFNDCTFNWEGDNCPGFIQIANYLKITVDLNNCVMNYTTNSQYTTAKSMVSCYRPDACTINVNGLKVNGTRNNDKIWKIISSYKEITINTTGELVYTFNGATIDFATYLK